MTTTGVGIAVFGAGSTGVVWLWRALRNHRTDIGVGQNVKEGSLPFGVLNVYNPQNYDQLGKKVLRWVYASTILQLLGFAILLSTV